jgi:hypothetical protein
MPHFIFIQQISVLNILNMLYNLHFFSSKCRLFHNATLFGFCIIHILNTGCAKIWKKISVAKRLTVFYRLVFMSERELLSELWNFGKRMSRPFMLPERCFMQIYIQSSSPLQATFVYLKSIFEEIVENLYMKFALWLLDGRGFGSTVEGKIITRCLRLW